MNKLNGECGSSVQLCSVVDILPGFLPDDLVLFPLTPPGLCLVLTPWADMALAALLLASLGMSYLESKFKQNTLIIKIQPFFSFSVKTPLI